MKVFITGIDGYLGWTLAQHLTLRGHTVGGIDNLLRRRAVAEMKSHSVTPIAEPSERLSAFEKAYGRPCYFREGDVLDYDTLARCLKDFKPDAIVHLGEIPSAPYSMIDRNHCTLTMNNNIVGTLNLLYAMKEECPDAHLVKLGTMGEYGTPNVDIPEGFFELEFRGRKDRLPFPRQAGSWYHWTKVHDSHNTMFACKMWGLRSTDIMQGVVYGTRMEKTAADQRLLTRFDIDQCFGTAINRFCAMAIVGHPLTLYGKGHQKRGFLPLKDSMQCLTLSIENPPSAGEYRVFNQFEEVYDLSELAAKVQKVAQKFKLDATVRNFENPRAEKDEHYYKPDHEHLLRLGYRPTHNMDLELESMFEDLLKHEARIQAVKEILVPDIRWTGSRKRSEIIHF